jgi:hypothetical protein
MNKTLGKVDTSYFVSRNELLRWINDNFELNYEKIEQVCSGALFCQMMDSLYPGKVPLHRVISKSLTFRSTFKQNLTTSTCLISKFSKIHSTSWELKKLLK